MIDFFLLPDFFTGGICTTFRWLLHSDMNEYVIGIAFAPTLAAAVFSYFVLFAHRISQTPSHMFSSPIRDLINIH